MTYNHSKKKKNFGQHDRLENHRIKRTKLVFCSNWPFVHSLKNYKTFLKTKNKNEIINVALMVTRPSSANTCTEP